MFAARLTRIVALAMMVGFTNAQTTCTNTCNYDSDAECDDGGLGSEYTIPSCYPGTDCADCGPRSGSYTGPTTPVYGSSNSWWNVDNSNVCQMSGNNCVTDGAGSYGSSERCTITALQPLYIKVTEFCTESTFDRLSTTMTSYSGESGPHRVYMSAGDTMTWTTDGSIQKSGFTICAYGSSSQVGSDGSGCRGADQGVDAGVGILPFIPLFVVGILLAFLIPCIIRARQKAIRSGQTTAQVLHTHASLRNFWAAQGGMPGGMPGGVAVAQPMPMQGFPMQPVPMAMGVPVGAPPYGSQIPMAMPVATPVGRYPFQNV